MVRFPRRPRYMRPRQGKTTRRGYSNRFIRRKIIGTGIHGFTRTTDVTIPIIDNATPLQNYAGDGVNATYKLSNLPNYTEFTALFDSYKIDKIKQTFIYSHNMSYQGQTYNGLPLIGIVRDEDDVTSLSTVADYTQYESFKLKRLDKIFSITTVPHMALATYSGAFTSYTDTKPMWLDCNSSGVEHYGFKWFLEKPYANASGQTAGTLRVITKYYLSFKNVR